MLAKTTRMPHIAFVLQGLGAGGSEHIISLLSNHFVQQGWLVTVFAFEDRSVMPYYAHDDRVRIFPLGLKSGRRSALGGLMATWRRVRLLRKAFEIAAPDVIVSFLVRTNVAALLAARPLNTPVIVSERNNPELQKVGLTWSLLRRFSYPKAVGLVTMTRGAMNYFAPPMRKREWIIPNPAPPTERREASTSRARTIVAVGRLVPQKGFDLLLEAFARVAQTHPDWTLVIWGEGPDRGELEAQRDRLGLSERVKMPGVTSVPGGWIDGAEVFVLSSRFEGWGLVLSEAMAAGLPVVSFECPWGPADMVTHEQTGLLVANGDIAALAEALQRVCTDGDLRDRLGRNARRAMDMFAPSRVFEAWEGAAREALALGRKENHPCEFAQS